jgi:Translationally controlled tumour protein
VLFHSILLAEVPVGGIGVAGEKNKIFHFSQVMKEMLGRFKNLQFFTGESMDPEAMICMCEYLDVDGSGNEKPILVSKPQNFFFSLTRCRSEK